VELTHPEPNCRIGVDEVGRPPQALQVHRQILPTRLTARRVKNGELGLLAYDLFVPQRKGEEATHEVRERI
jgi:hypothetical protein